MQAQSDCAVSPEAVLGNAFRSSSLSTPLWPCTSAPRKYKYSQEHQYLRFVNTEIPPLNARSVLTQRPHTAKPVSAGWARLPPMHKRQAAGCQCTSPGFYRSIQYNVSV